ncbi:uncharacterized protein LOC113772329 [Coffea eugenioides]|uniref:uncharacterized protein LOC113772329 n=1 Tax=Coffea eugenioides TaxID=49369 RepID=UPI000F6049ED|nr:uncharacterized protein LOC113772329 [Coffea eugenioides]
MAGATAKFHQNFAQNKMDKFYGDQESFTELIFGFIEEFSEDSSESSCSSTFEFDDRAIIDEGVDEDENFSIVEESKAFWESQEDLLQTALCRTTSIEKKIRQATKEAVRDISSVGLDCACEKMVGNSCEICLKKEICNRLRNAGYNCVVCKSKWRKSPEIPSGEHTYLEVVQNSKGAKGEVKIIVELNFRAQFEMARASEEYNRLINQLPEIFVGKFLRLQNLVKILCAASKKCMRERKMHIAPWRKYKYMLAKWHGSPDQQKVAPILSPVSYLGRATRPRTSMLTFDLVGSLQGIQCTTMIKVV